MKPLQTMARGLIRILEMLGPYRTYRILAECYRINPGAVGRHLSYWLENQLPDRPLADEVLSKYATRDFLIQQIKEETDRQNSPFYAFHVFAEVDRICRTHARTPSRVLEIGPGSSLGAIACFLAAGAECAAAVDIQPMEGDRGDQYRQMGELLSCVSGFSWWRNYAEAPADPRATYPLCWRPEQFLHCTKRVVYKAPAPADALPFEDHAFDLVYSIAVLERVSDASAVAREIARVTSTGGLSVHEIDLRHHGSSDFTGFLRYSDADWEKRTQKYGDGKSIDGILDGSWTAEVFCNRLRRSDWEKVFRTSGFELLQCETLCAVDTRKMDRAALAAEFRNRTDEDLSAVLIRITARKTS